MGALRPFKVAYRAQRHDLEDVGRLRYRRSRGYSSRRISATSGVSLRQARNRSATPGGNMLSSSPTVLTLNSQTGRSRSSAAFWSANCRASGSH